MRCTKCNKDFDIGSTDGDVYICDLCYYYEKNKENILELYTLTD